MTTTVTPTATKQTTNTTIATARSASSSSVARTRLDRRRRVLRVRPGAVDPVGVVRADVLAVALRCVAAAGEQAGGRVRIAGRVEARLAFDGVAVRGRGRRGQFECGERIGDRAVADRIDD